MRFAEGVWLNTPGFASLEAQKLLPRHAGRMICEHACPEFGPYFGQCRFTGCSHRSETGCAVREAVEAGTEMQQNALCKLPCHV